MSQPSEEVIQIRVEELRHLLHLAWDCGWAKEKWTTLAEQRSIAMKSEDIKRLLAEHGVRE